MHDCRDFVASDKTKWQKMCYTTNLFPWAQSRWWAKWWDPKVGGAIQNSTKGKTRSRDYYIYSQQNSTLKKKKKQLGRTWHLWHCHRAASRHLPMKRDKYHPVWNIYNCNQFLNINFMTQLNLSVSIKGTNTRIKTSSFFIILSFFMFVLYV